MAIVTGIDHLILTTTDLAAASTFLASVLGLHVSGGGAHPMHGTQNRIIVLRDEYIELLGAQTGRLQTGPASDLLRFGAGFGACILGVADPRAVATALAEKGMVMDGPSTGLLDAGPDFSRGWSTITPTKPVLPGFPFLIKHDFKGEERRRLLAGAVGLAAHPLGATHIASLTVAVHDLAQSMELFTRFLEIEASASGTDPMLQSSCVRLHLPSGADIILAAPLRPAEGPIASALRERGEGTFAFNIAVHDLSSAVRTLRGRGIGVRVDEPDGILVAAQIHHANPLAARIGLVSTY